VKLTKYPGAHFPYIEVATGRTGSRKPNISDIGTGAYQLISDVVTDVDPDMIVAPNLLAAGTDSRHFTSVTSNIYRFTPLALDIEDTIGVHGVNERIGIEDFAASTQLYHEILKRSGDLDETHFGEVMR